MELTDDIRAAIHRQLTARPKQPSAENARRYVFRPYFSDALGVAPSQIEAARQEARKHGVLLDFTPDGRAIITSQKQVKEIAKTFGMWNGRDGFRAHGSHGQEVLTGREAAERRRALRGQIQRHLREQGF